MRLLATRCGSLQEYDMEWAPYLSFAATLIFTTGGIYKLFDAGEKALSDDGRRWISDWLYGLDVRSALSTWPSRFEGLFDSVFGKRLFSLPTFAKSTAASLLSLLLTACLWFAASGYQYLDHESVLPHFSRLTRDALLVMAVINPLPDYISLVETRLIMRRLSKASSWLSRGGLIVLDLVLTSLIAVGESLLFLTHNYWWPWYWRGANFYMLPLQYFFRLGPRGSPAPNELLGGMVANLALYGGMEDGKNATLEMLKSQLLLSDGVVSLSGVILYSTFFTSVWAWLYLGSILAFYGGRRLGSWADTVRLMFDFEKQPVRSLGIAAAALWAVFLLFVGAVSYFM